MIFPSFVKLIGILESMFGESVETIFAQWTHPSLSNGRLSNCSIFHFYSILSRHFCKQAESDLGQHCLLC